MYSQALIAPPTAAKREREGDSRPGKAERRFCPGMTCFTDDMLVRRVSSHTDVWLLTDESEETSWLMQAKTPVCPSCGATLLSTDGHSFRISSRAV